MKRDEDLLAWTDAAPPREPEHRVLSLVVFVMLPIAVTLAVWCVR